MSSPVQRHRAELLSSHPYTLRLEAVEGRLSCLVEEGMGGFEWTLRAGCRAAGRLVEGRLWGALGRLCVLRLACPYGPELPLQIHVEHLGSWRGSSHKWV